MTRTAVITIAHGRHAHWAAQQTALSRSHDRPDDRILVAMDDPALAAAAREVGNAHVVELECSSEGLPLAKARNEGARTALARGADVLIFLDLDCLPSPELVGAYSAAARGDWRGHLLAGPVTYLDPSPPGGYDLASLDHLDDPHPARPAPRSGEILEGGSHDLFWSLSFALSADTWQRIGGFHEEYVGYGGEDTDFAWSARERGIELAWLGSARAYHQHHSVEDPPVRHLDAILRNAALFHSRWDIWPMKGWLDAFERDGLVARSDDGSYRSTAASHR